MITLDDTLSAVTAVQTNVNTQCPDETGTGSDHAIVTDQRDWYLSHLALGDLGTMRDILVLLREAESWSLPDRRMVNAVRMTRVVEICDPDLRHQINSEYAYENSLDCARASTAASLLLAAFNDTLPSTIHELCVKTHRPEVIPLIRSAYPYWIRSWEW